MLVKLLLALLLLVLPLHRAMLDGERSTVERLLAEGAPVDEPDAEGRTALVLALLRRDLRLVGILLAHKANPNVIYGGREPLFEAVDAGSRALVNTLLDNGAEVDQLAGDTGSALHEAALRGNTAVLLALLDPPANARLDTLDGAGHTPLQAAAAAGRLEAVRLLLTYGAPADDVALKLAADAKVHDLLLHPPKVRPRQEREIRM